MQQFDLDLAQRLLERTPATLDAWLRGLPDAWLHAREDREDGKGWTPAEIVGHLIHGDEADWVPRARRILEHGPSKAFDPFDRLAHLGLVERHGVDELLDMFAERRGASLVGLAALQLQPADLDREGLHPDPDLGTVTMRQLLSTWVAHDQSHIAQIARILAKEYREATGPWRLYLPLLDRP